MKSSLVLAMRWCVSPILLSVMSVAGSAIGESITAGEFFQNHEKYDLAGSFLIWSQLGCERVSVVTHTHTHPFGQNLRAQRVEAHVKP